MGPASRRVPRVFVYTERTVDGMGKITTDKRAGFTLMELMVYIAIVGIVVIVAGQAFSNSTKMRVRTQSMLKASEVAENVAALMKDDIAQMGAKSAKEAGEAAAGADFGDMFSDIDNAIYMDPTNATASLIDSSSFTISNTEGASNLTFRRIRYDANGHYAGIEEVSWFVSDGSLWRNCKVLKKVGTLAADDPCSDGAESTPTDMEMATGVTEFNVVPSRPGAMGDAIQVFPATGETNFKFIPRTEDPYISLSVVNSAGEVGKGGTSQILSGFFSNYNTAAEALVNEENRKLNELIAVRDNSTLESLWKPLCALTFEPGEEYEISFEVPYPGSTTDNSLLFVPGVDHMSVGLRDRETGEVPKVNDVAQVEDFMFFPPLDVNGGGKRSMRFSVPNKIEHVCLAFSFACYSPLVSQGHVTISNLKVTRVPSASYDFSGFAAEDNKNDKQNVKAFQLNLKIARNGESGNVTLVIPTPSNGPTD